MCVAEFGEQFTTADPLRQTERGISRGIRGALDLQYLPDCGGKAQHGYCGRAPCQDSKNLGIGGQIGEQRWASE